MQDVALVFHIDEARHLRLRVHPDEGEGLCACLSVCVCVCVFVFFFLSFLSSPSSCALDPRRWVLIKDGAYDVARMCFRPSVVLRDPKRKHPA